MKSLNTKEWIAVGITLVAVLILLVVSPMIRQKASIAGDDTSALQPAAPESASAISGLQVTDVSIGSGTEAVAGKTVAVHYVGTLTNGAKFDSSLDRGEPIQFVLGSGQVIPGWDMGITGMKVGGKRHLVIPPDLAYGSQGVAVGGKVVIPSNATLVFDVELMSVK